MPNILNPLCLDDLRVQLDAASANRSGTERLEKTKMAADKAKAGPRKPRGEKT